MAEQNADLLKQAEELEIAVDKRWGDARIQSEIDKALGGERDPLDHDGDGKKGGAAPALVAVSVKRDFWTANPADPDNPIRHESGSVVEVSVEAAMDGIEAGVLSRVR